MKTSSLQNNRPHLEAVLGPLSSNDDAKIRAIFAEAEVVLLEIANHFQFAIAEGAKVANEVRAPISATDNADV